MVYSTPILHMIWCSIWGKKVQIKNNIHYYQTQYVFMNMIFIDSAFANNHRHRKLISNNQLVIKILFSICLYKIVHYIFNCSLNSEQNYFHHIYWLLSILLFETSSLYLGRKIKIQKARIISSHAYKYVVGCRIPLKNIYISKSIHFYT